VFRRRDKRSDPVARSYATSSDVVPGEPTEYPDRGPESAALHAQAYEEQRVLLQKELAEMGQGDELFVAKVFVVQRPDGTAHTYTTWTEGIRTLLPPADLVLLVEQPPTPDTEPTMTWLRWDVTAHVCADTCWKVMPEFEPPRILTQDWPSPKQLDLLKSKRLH
jgi:hypothetical protein